MKVEQPRYNRISYDNDDYRLNIEQENCYRRPSVAFKREEHGNMHKITIESEEEDDFPPPYTGYSRKNID